MWRRKPVHSVRCSSSMDIYESVGMRQRTISAAEFCIAAISIASVSNGAQWRLRCKERMADLYACGTPAGNACGGERSGDMYCKNGSLRASGML